MQSILRWRGHCKEEEKIGIDIHGYVAMALEMWRALQELVLDLRQSNRAPELRKFYEIFARMS